MRPVTDRHQVSRAKLAYIIDATAAPVCIIAPISSWAAAVTSSVPEEAGINGFSVFIQTIPYNLYAILTLCMLLAVTILKVDFGLMKKHEDNAARGDLFTSGAEEFKQVKEEEVVEGMEAEEEEFEDEDEPEYDEHVWLSLKNTETLCNAITDALEGIDPANKDAYAASAASYLEKLAALDGEYQTVVDNATRKTVLFGDRFPFRYLVDDYGLSYYAAFVGCSAETEASFETISFLAGKVDELGLPCVLTIEGAQHKIAETIVQNSAAKNQSILTLNSMQSTTSADAVNGTTYLSVMESNLDVLKQALN